MTNETKMAIYEATGSELEKLIHRVYEGSLLDYEKEHLLNLFNDFVNINTAITKDLHKGYVENLETINELNAKLKQSFNMLATITSDLTGKEIPRV